MRQSQDIGVRLARQDAQAVARICRKSLGWWNVAEFSRFAKEPLVEINACRARRGDWSYESPIYSRAK